MQKHLQRLLWRCEVGHREHGRQSSVLGSNLTSALSEREGDLKNTSMLPPTPRMKKSGSGMAQALVVCKLPSGSLCQDESHALG